MLPDEEVKKLVEKILTSVQHESFLKDLILNHVKNWQNVVPILQQHFPYLKRDPKYMDLWD